MFLSALLLAAAVNIAPPMIVEPRGPAQVVRALRRSSEQHVVRALLAKPGCRTSGVERLGQGAPDGAVKVQRLGDQPPANHTLTVLRSVDGCPVSSTVRFNVDSPAGR